MKKSNQTGFSIVEALIIVLVLAVVGGAGWYVYQKSHKASAKNSNTSQTTSSTKAATINYFTLAQWNVRAPYSGNLTLTVQNIDNEHAVLSSKQLLDHADSAGCISPNSTNFVIQRYGANDYVTDNRLNDTGSALTAAQAYTKSNLNLTKVGDSYFLYQTIKAPCSESVYNAIPQFSQTDAAFKSITEHLVVDSNTATKALPELGVKIVNIPPSVSDLTYHTTNKTGTLFEVQADFSTETLTNNDSSCSFGSVGSIFKAKGTFNSATDTGPFTFVKQFSGFWVAYKGSGVPCSQNSTTFSLQTSQISDFSEVVKNANNLEAL